MPQPAKQVKVRRKDLRKPDEFETLTGRVFDWAQEHRSVLATVGAVLALGAVVALGLGWWQASRQQAAGAAFQRAQVAFEAGRYGEAARAFGEIAESYPRTPFGRLARLYRGHALARAGDLRSAETAYGEYLARTREAEYLRQQALLGVARSKEAGGDGAGALEAYTQAGALRGPHRTDALLGAARLHESAGRVFEARQIYADLLKDGTDPETQALLAAKLAALGTPPAEAETP